MSTFTIDSDNNITALAELPAGADESQSFTNQKELAKLTADWAASRLVDTWNSFAGVAPFDEEISCCSCLVTPNELVSLSVNEVITFVCTRWGNSVQAQPRKIQ